jgi:tetratricopeptide (TPR) repeat protein
MGLLKIGGSWYTELYKDSPTLILLDFSLPPHGVYSLQAGMEQNLWDNFYARAGYQWAWDNNDINGLTGLTAGIGLRFEDWGLDYAFIPYGDLGTSQTLGLTYSFPYITPHPPQKTVPAAPRAAFKPADTLLPGDRLVNVEVKVQLPSGSGSQFATAEDPELQYAIKQQVEKVAQHPKDAKAWYNLATLYWKAGKRAFTAQCFEEILQLQPQNQAIKDWLDKNRQERSNTGLGAE